VVITTEIYKLKGENVRFLISVKYYIQFRDLLIEFSNVDI